MAYGPVIYGSGDGSSEANSKNINGTAAWEQLAADVAAGAITLHYKVSADIDWEGATPTSLNYTYAFGGYLHGNGKKFSNMVLDGTDRFRMGLIDKLNGPDALIENLTIDNASITATFTQVETGHCGILVGEVVYGSNITNCNVLNSTITYTHNKVSQVSYVGLICGANHGIISDCRSSGTINTKISAGTQLTVGGVVGVQTGSASGGVAAAGLSLCTSSATITDIDGASTISCLVGGIAGSLKDENTNGNYITTSSFTGVIDYTGNNAIVDVGGIVGLLVSGVITDSYAECGITQVQGGIGTGASLIGGAVGYISGGSIARCYCDCNISIARGDIGTYEGGFVGRVANGVTITDCYASGSIYDATASSNALTFLFGGFAGHTANGVFSNCWTAFSTYSDDVDSLPGYVKGFYSQKGASASFAGCFWNKTTSGLTAANTGATGKTTSEMLDISTYDTYDFNLTGGRIWKMQDVSGYPILDWQEGISGLTTPRLPKPHYTWGQSFSQLTPIKVAFWTNYARITGSMCTNMTSTVADRAYIASICASANAKVALNYSPWNKYWRKIAGGYASDVENPLAPTAAQLNQVTGDIDCIAELDAYDAWLSTYSAWVTANSLTIGCIMLDSERMKTTTVGMVKADMLSAMEVFRTKTAAEFPGVPIYWFARCSYVADSPWEAGIAATWYSDETTEALTPYWYTPGKLATVPNLYSLDLATQIAHTYFLPACVVTDVIPYISLGEGENGVHSPVDTTWRDIVYDTSISEDIGELCSSSDNIKGVIFYPGPTNILSTTSTSSSPYWQEHFDAYCNGFRFGSVGGVSSGSIISETWSW